MSDLRTLRFTEYDYYDIWDDAEKTRLLAITNIGTWHADVRSDRRKTFINGEEMTCQKAFEIYVKNALACNLEPCEVCFGD